jgi:hypothetical protein
MVASLTYRTADGTRWGGGQGSDLAAVTIDLNFWLCFSAIQALEDNVVVNAGIDYINQPSGSNFFYVHLTNHAVLGPFVIPTSQWNARGAWAATTAYGVYDLVTDNGSLYLVITAHTSGATFSAGATDGLGHNLYSLLLAQPSNSLPAAGSPGQKLVRITSTPYTTQWKDDVVRLVSFVAGQPLPGELLMQYSVVENMTLPVGLSGSVFKNGTAAAASVSYTLNKNGSSIGFVTFNGSSITVAFATAVTFVSGDIITLVAPSILDAAQANISITLVALLT